MKHEYVITFFACGRLWEKVVDTADLEAAKEAASALKAEFGNATLARRPAGVKGTFPNWDRRRQPTPTRIRETPRTGVQCAPSGFRA